MLQIIHHGPGFVVCWVSLRAGFKALRVQKNDLSRVGARILKGPRWKIDTEILFRWVESWTYEGKKKYPLSIEKTSMNGYGRDGNATLASFFLSNFTHPKTNNKTWRLYFCLFYFVPSIAAPFGEYLSFFPTTFKQIWIKNLAEPPLVSGGERQSTTYKSIFSTLRTHGISHVFLAFLEVIT